MESVQLKNTVENEIFPLIKTLGGNSKTAFSRYMQNVKFEIDSPQKLVAVITYMDDLYKTMKEELKDHDTMGDIYEYKLSKLGSSDKLGQFRTPRHIIGMMVELIKPTLGDNICDEAVACLIQEFLPVFVSAFSIHKNYRLSHTEECAKQTNIIAG